MSANNGQHWKEKYLNLVEEQEKSEKASAEQQELLRRTLVRVSLAADGLDPELDSALGGLRAMLKKGKMTGLARHLDGLEQEVIRFEARKAERQNTLQEALSAICEQLLSLQADSASKRKLKALSKRTKRFDELSELGSLLQEISAAQASVLQLEGENTDKPKKGLLDRFLGNAATPHDDLPPADTRAEDSMPLGSDDQTPEIIAAQETSSPTIDLHTLSVRVTFILQKMLDDIEPATCVAEKISNAKQRISRGLNWQDLVPTLEDIRDLIMQSHLAANDNFAAYLKTLNDDLLSISKLLKLTDSVFQEQQSQDEKNQTVLVENLNSIVSETAAATELNKLKQTITDRVKTIRESMEQTQTSTSISGQIKDLLEQVQALENQAQKTNENLNKQREKARTDPLTGLPNREAYNERSHQEWIRWSRYKNPTSMAVIDIDHFKNINDSYGHQTGDKVLKLVSKEFAKRLREVDFICRYGGEEFVVLLPETAKEDAFKALDAIRQGVDELPFHFKEQPVAITVSIGISEFHENDTVESLFSRADNAMYEAKHAGRNCTRISG